MTTTLTPLFTSDPFPLSISTPFFQTQFNDFNCSSLATLFTGTWRSFNEIYRTNYDTYTHPISLKGIGYDLYEKEKEKSKNKSLHGKKHRNSKEVKFEGVAITSTWTLQEIEEATR